MGNENAKPGKHQEDEVFPATVAKVLSPWRVVINRGETQGIRTGQRLLIYALSEDEVVDPTTGESLGYLELVRGTGKVTHAQERMSTVESDRREPSARSTVRSLLGLTGPTSVEERIAPSSLARFEDPEIGDKAKPI